MLGVLAFVLAAVAVTVVLHLVADRSGIPAAALLTVAGLTYGLLPGPNIELDPDLVLTFVLPPLLYSAALNASLLAIRQNLRAVISLSVLLVLATALLVGIGSPCSCRASRWRQASPSAAPSHPRTRSPRCRSAAAPGCRASS